MAIVKRQTSAVGHDVHSGVGNSIGSPGDASLPKNGGKIPFGTVLNELANCDVSIVPDCLRALYQFPPNFPANSKSESTPTYEVQEHQLTLARFVWNCRVHSSSLSWSDLDIFFANFSPSLVGKRPTLDSIDGGFIRTRNESFDFNGESVRSLEPWHAVN
jgi:tripeptidyl-peptidase-1